MPCIWLFNRADTPPSTLAPGAATIVLSTADIIADPLAADAPAILEGPKVPDNPVVVQIGVPAQPNVGKIEGTAVFERAVGAGIGATTDTCSAPGAPFNATLTVSNLNNGRELTCVNRAPQVLPDNHDLLLTSAQFLTIAELVDSPIPVVMTWPL